MCLNLYTEHNHKMSGGQQNGDVSIMKALNLFQRPNIQDAVEREYTVEYRPSEQFIDERSPVIFNIPKQSRDFTDLRSCSLKMKLRVKRRNDTDLQFGEEVSLINMCHQTAWSQMDVTINGVPVSSNTRLYPYKAFFKALTRNAGVSESSALKSMGWFSPFTGNSRAHAKDEAWAESKRLVRNSRLLELEGPLMEDIFESERYLLNGTEMQIKLHRCLSPFMLNLLYTTSSSIASDANIDALKVKMEADIKAVLEDNDNTILIMAANKSTSDYNNAVGSKQGYKVVLEDIVLKMAYVRVYPHVITAIQESLQQNPALYPLTRTEMKSVAIPDGQQQVYFDTVFSGLRPSKIVLGFVSSEAVNASFATDALNFESHNVSDISIMIDGTVIQPKKLIYDDRGDGQEYLSAFMDYMTMVKKSGYEVPYATPEEFQKHPIFTFALEPIEHSDIQNQAMKGPVSVIIQFARQLDRGVNLLMYAEMPGLVQIDAARNIAIS